MRIDSSRVAMESTRNYRSSTTAIGRFTFSAYRQGLNQGGNALNAAIGGETGTMTKQETMRGSKRSLTTMQDWQTRFQATSSRITVRSNASQQFMELQQQTLRYIFDLLFGGRRRFGNLMDNYGGQNYTGQTNDMSNGQVQNGYTSSVNITYQDGFFRIQQSPQPATDLKLVDFAQDNINIEREDTTFSTVGTVRTSDGREINFNVNVGMSRGFQEYVQNNLTPVSTTMCDPLVINMDTDVATLSDQTFYFDIDADGEMDEISQLGAGSGYLALDKNGDGKINDGSELFGTASGNGFADLAKYDDDGNGWIDENDAVWARLKIWAKDENGNDVLYRLAEKGVGAICLQNVSTDFTQKGQSGQTLGAVRNTGVFLYENGNVGTVQHVDVAKYQKQA